MFGLTTSLGTVLAIDRVARRVIHLPLGEVDAADLVLLPDPALPQFGVRGPDGAWRPIDPGGPVATRSLPPPPPQLMAVDGLARFRFSGGHLSVAEDGALAASAEAGERETFGLVPAETLAHLIGIAASDWLRLGQRVRIGRHAIGLSGQANLRIGGRAYPIAGSFPLSPEAVADGRLILLRDGFKLDRFLRFKPLVAFALVGGGTAEAEQLALATLSLERHGGYEGELLVISDRDPAELVALLPPGLHPNLSTLPVAGGDPPDEAALARLMLAEFPGLAGYGPILSCDLDLVFDRPLAPLLERIAFAGCFSAPSGPADEPCAPPGSDDPGAALFDADPLERRDPAWFDAAALAMPGGPATRETLSVLRRGAIGWLAERRRRGLDELPGLDRAILDYGLRKLELFHPSPLSEAIRWADLDADPPPDGAVGLVGFGHAAATPAGRASRMRAYLASLDDAPDPA